MKIWKLLKEQTEARVLAICLVLFLLFGLSFTGLGTVSVVSFWLCLRFIPILFLIRFFIETCQAFSKAVKAETKKEKYANIAFGILAFVFCVGLVWLIMLPNNVI